MQARRDRAADARVRGARTRAPTLPSGRDHLPAAVRLQRGHEGAGGDNPGLVRPITLNHKTYEGRPVEGIEIATNVNARDGQPVFLQLGVHHAREWPSGEHAMEWAYELINGYRNGDARARNLVTRPARSSSRS